jgi:hypothetical protein
MSAKTGEGLDLLRGYLSTLAEQNAIKANCLTIDNGNNNNIILND